MKSVLNLLILLITQLASGQTNLQPGDLALVKVNTDNPDAFAFIFLSPADSGTIIHFTDRGWDSAGFFRSGEGTMTFATNRAYQCGERVDIDSVYGISLSASGDQILVYQGADSNPNFITALNLEGQAEWQSTASSTATSALPAGLTNGANAAALFEYDNIRYNGSTSGSKNSLTSELFDSSNFTGHNTNQQQFTSTFSISGACVLPVHWLSLDYDFRGEECRIYWSTASELDNHYFEVQISTDGTEWVDNGIVFGHGTSLQINKYEISIGALTTSVYCRIRQVDYNGNSTYSSVISVPVTQNQCSASIVNGSLLLQSRTEQKVEIYSLQGTLLQEIDLEGNRIVNLEEFDVNSIVIIMVDKTRTGLVSRFVFMDLLTSK